MWPKQAQIATAIQEHPRVSVRSGHKTGKSDGAAAIALWWVSDPVNRPEARVVMSSSSARQVKSILWKAVKRCYNRAKKKGRPLGGVLHKTPDNGLQFEDGREIIGFSTKEPERFAGYSGKWLLFILDEASGIPQEIFDVIEGNRAGGARALYLSNPTKTSGEFYESHNSKENLYYAIHISSRDTPNALTGQELIPGLASLSWCDEKRDEWGEDDPRYQVRVLGEFPGQASTAAVPLSLVNAAQKRQVVAAGDLVFGLDVARFGDDQPILCPRVGAKTYPLIVLPNGDGDSVAGFARERAREFATSLGIDEEATLRINVDEIGVGAAVYDALQGYSDIEVVGVNVSEPASDPNEYFNLRTELYFLARKWLKTGSLPNDPDLKQELIAHEYDFAPSTGACRLEPKEKVKKKIGRSPDRSDAFVLSLYDGDTGRYTSARGKPGKKAKRR